MRQFWILDFGFWISKRGWPLIGLLMLLPLAGCLPYSCHRIESRALTPADSVSRALADQLTPDTLQLAWTTTGPDGDGALTYPRTLLFDDGGHLYVSDAKRNSVFVFGKDGTFLDEWTWDGLAIPYLAGRRGDTLFVFSPEAHRLDMVVDGVPIHHLATPSDLPRGPLHYAAATNDALFFKVVAKDYDGYIARLGADGAVLQRYDLPGPYWRHAGLLRAWGDTLLSLSGYRPVVDVLTPGGTLDTLALTGFDSPMLARSFAFMRGDTRDAPLLSAAAAPVGDRLFVLNMRPGWLRIDVFDRKGRLLHELVQDNPGFNKQFFPVDLAVHATDDGAYLIAVAQVEPVPEVRIYRWPGSAFISAASRGGS